MEFTSLVHSGDLQYTLQSLSVLTAISWLCGNGQRGCVEGWGRWEVFTVTVTKVDADVDFLSF